MNVRYLQLLLGICCLLAVPLSHAQVYKWVDDSGVVHFTDDPANVPKTYWDRVEEKKTLEEEVPKPSGKGGGPKRRVQRESTDRFGRRASWWRDRASKWWAQMRHASSQHQRISGEIKEAKKVLGEARNDGKRRRYRRKIQRLQEEDEKYRAQIEEARRMLHGVLLDEARMAGADPLWLRP
jgi:hypothetical protein